MIDHFNRLPANEQKVILGACMAEFAEKGYLRASTNAMVKNAGIPKGTLFYYFGSKKELFLFLVDKAVSTYQQFTEEFNTHLPSDVFERLFYLVDVRMQFALRKPAFYRFLYKTLLEIPDALLSDMEERFVVYHEANKGLMQEGVDTSMLREGVSLDQVLDLVSMLQEGMLSRFSKQLSEMEAAETLQFVDGMRKKTQDQFDLIRKGVYRSD